MRIAFACLLLLVLGLTPAIAQTRLSGAFIASTACPALQSIKKNTNPGNVTLTAGTSYNLLGGNKTPATYYWIVVPGATPDYRWVPVDCGKLDPTATASAAAAATAASGASSSPRADYVLALSWEPAFCEGLPDKAECKSQTAQSYEATHLSLHGLWPQPRSKSYCGVAAAVIASDKAHDWSALPAVTLSPSTKADLDEIMPGTKSMLERHEWIVHGTCSGAAEDAYFHRASLFAGTVDNTAVNALLAGRVGQHVDSSEIRAAFDTAFGKGAGDRVRIACERDGDRSLISEITIGLRGDVMGTGGIGELVLAAPATDPGCPGGIVDPVGLQ
jgi:ribonuclease T2